MLSPQQLRYWENGAIRGFEKCVLCGCSSEEATDRLAKFLCEQHGKDDGFRGKNRASAEQCIVSTLLAHEFGLPTMALLDFERFHFLYATK